MKKLDYKTFMDDRIEDIKTDNYHSFRSNMKDLLKYQVDGETKEYRDEKAFSDALPRLSESVVTKKDDDEDIAITLYKKFNKKTKDIAEYLKGEKFAMKRISSIMDLINKL